jgi:uncharacterized phage infection (PIP) family protein YhgE
MQTKGELIFKDVITVICFSLIIYTWNTERWNIWAIIFVLSLIRQIMAHRTYFKLKNRFY